MTIRARRFRVSATLVIASLALAACGDIGDSMPIPKGIRVGYVGKQHLNGPVVYAIEKSETGADLVPKRMNGVTIDRMFVPDTNWYTPLVIGELIQDDPSVSPKFVGYFVLELKDETLEVYQTWAEVQRRLTDGHVTDLPDINDMRPAKHFYWAHPEE